MALKDDVDKYLPNPVVRAWLDTIGAMEGTVGGNGHGYNAAYGRDRLSDLSGHPGAGGQYGFAYTGKDQKRYRATPAGRYQITHSTWKRMAPQVGAKSFSPEDQDRVALGLIISRGALPDILAGRTDAAVRKLGEEWVALPGSATGQRVHGGTHTAPYFLGVLNRNLKQRGQGAVSMTFDGKPVVEQRLAAGAGQTRHGLFTQMALQSLLGAGTGHTTPTALGDLLSPMSDVNNAPIPMDTARHLSLSADPGLTPDNAQALIERLRDDPLEKYGMSFAGSGLRPTITRVDPSTGRTVQMIEYPNGVYVNADTGEQVDRLGQALPISPGLATVEAIGDEPWDASSGMTQEEWYAQRPGQPSLVPVQPVPGGPVEVVTPQQRDAMAAARLQPQVVVQDTIAEMDPFSAWGGIDAELIKRIRQMPVQVK